MKYLVAVLFFSITCISFIFAQDDANSRVYTLEEALDAGMKTGKELRISESKVTASQARVNESGSQMLPQLKFMAGYTRLSDVPPFEVTMPIPGLPVNRFVISEAILNSYTLRMSVQQPLFTGFRLSSLKNASKQNLKAAEEDYSKDLNETAWRIATAYWNFYKAGQMQKYLTEAARQTMEHLEDTRNFLSQGLVTQNDVLKLEVQYANTRLQLIEAQNNLDIARAAFNQTIGLPIDANTITDTLIPSNSEKMRNFDELLSEAKHSRSELKAMLHRTEAAKNSVTAARSGWYPQIFLNGNVYYSRPNARIMPAKDRFDDTWDIGITLNWDIWNWGLTSAQTIQAKQVQLQNETALSQLTDAIEIEVYQNYLTLKRAKERIEVSMQSTEQARENLRIINDKYSVQLATSSDLIDAETALLQANTNYNTALVDYQLALTRLNRSIGQKIY